MYRGARSPSDHTPEGRPRREHHRVSVGWYGEGDCLQLDDGRGAHGHGFCCRPQDRDGDDQNYGISRRCSIRFEWNLYTIDLRCICVTLCNANWMLEYMLCNGHRLGPRKLILGQRTSPAEPRQPLKGRHQLQLQNLSAFGI
jgi:hypothetical protein